MELANNKTEILFLRASLLVLIANTSMTSLQRFSAHQCILLKNTSHTTTKTLSVSPQQTFLES